MAAADRTASKSNQELFKRTRALGAFIMRLPKIAFVGALATLARSLIERANWHFLRPYSCRMDFLLNRRQTAYVELDTGRRQECPLAAGASAGTVLEIVVRRQQGCFI